MVKVKEWMTFWLFLFAYSFTVVISLLEFFYFKIFIFHYVIFLLFGVFFLIGYLLRIYTKYLLGKFFDLNIKIKDDHEIIKEGIYGSLRHPMYLANFLIFVGFAGFFSSILGIISAIIFILPVTVMRIIREEYYLKEKFGKKYEKYVKESYKMIPGLW